MKLHSSGLGISDHNNYITNKYIHFLENRYQVHKPY